MLWEESVHTIRAARELDLLVHACNELDVLLSPGAGVKNPVGDAREFLPQ